MELSEATAQDIQLELIRRSKFNEFNGERVYKDLMENRGLWRAVVFTRACDEIELVLRDLPENEWLADMILILVDGDKVARMLRIVKKWDADVVKVIDCKYVNGKIIMAWWD